jgi:hypothetical protein
VLASQQMAWAPITAIRANQTLPPVLQAIDPNTGIASPGYIEGRGEFASDDTSDLIRPKFRPSGERHPRAIIFPQRRSLLTCRKQVVCDSRRTTRDSSTMTPDPCVQLPSFPPG